MVSSSQSQEVSALAERGTDELSIAWPNPLIHLERLGAAGWEDVGHNTSNFLALQ